MPLTVYRDNQRKSFNITIDELDLEAEQGRTARRSEPNAEQEPTSTGFGMTLEPITPDLARRMDLPPNQGGAVVSDVDRESPAGNAGIVPGDVILEVNRQKVATVTPGHARTAESRRRHAGVPADLARRPAGVRHDDEALM